MAESRKPRRKKWWVLQGVSLLLVLLMLACVLEWRAHPRMQFLFYVAAVGWLLLKQPLLKASRPAAGNGGDRPRGLEAAKLSPRGLRTIGIGLVLVGLVLVAVTFNGSFWPLLGIIGLFGAIAGIFLIGNYSNRAPSSGTESGEVATPKAISRFDRYMRGVGIALVPLMVFSALALFYSAATGYHDAWPFYAFVNVVLVSLLVWPYLVARAYSRWLRR